MQKVERAIITVHGAVQGVGFRPFVYRLARDLALRGWVINSAQGVFIEVEGDAANVGEFMRRLEFEPPSRAVIRSIETRFDEPAGYEKFEIRESAGQGGKSVLILPDLATCENCSREILDPANRRYRYPFTNCTNCGPRFSIIEALPYDRANTTMKKFAMCEECALEYHDPADRRFHAQPNACPRCGPQLALWDATGKSIATRDQALKLAADHICDGSIVALKGIGGFQLIVDARNEAAVKTLRERKHREEKPFALMVASTSQARAICDVSPAEAALLESAECPIVLLRRRPDIDAIARGIAPNNPQLGVMLQYSPLHHLLMAELGFPIVATSGNLSDEPICIDEREAIERLRGIADFYLVHDRPIVRQMDDSICRVLLGEPQMLRRARGYAPFPVHVNELLPPILAVGAHLKATVALSVGSEVFISQHIGDLQTAAAHEAFRKVVADLPRLYEVQPEAVACDLHPDYLSTQFAASLSTPRYGIQHHYAHVLACMADNDLEPPVLGVAWDGTGLGTDGTIWGGEFLAVKNGEFDRVAHLRQFRLPGGDAAVKEPRRAALGLLYEVYGEALWDRPEVPAFSPEEQRLLSQMLKKNINSPLTSSAGRLFDAVAALAGLRGHSNFEGQAAMELEFAAENGVEDAYPFNLHGSIIDWQPMILELLHDRENSVDVGTIAARFQNTLAEIIVAVAKRTGLNNVALTGGCFQNRLLTERAVHRLRQEGFQPHWHRHVPPNDGGIALGQIIGAAWAMRAEKNAPKNNENC